MESPIIQIKNIDEFNEIYEKVKNQEKNKMLCCCGSYFVGNTIYALESHMKSMKHIYYLENGKSKKEIIMKNQIERIEPKLEEIENMYKLTLQIKNGTIKNYFIKFNDKNKEKKFKIASNYLEKFKIMNNL